MKTKRRNKHPWRFKAWLVLLAFAPILSCGCCVFFFYPQETYDPPRTIGVRKDAQGNLVEQIVCHQSYQTFGYLPGPHGFYPNRRYSHKFFLEQPGKPRRELSFLANEHLCAPDSSQAVSDTRLWVRAGFYGGQRLSVLVFDDSQIVRRRNLKNTYREDQRENFWFENGNRRVAYWGGGGVEAYDVITDTVVPWKQPGNR
jgi:hypothetical protein